MADARRDFDKRRATHIAETAPAGPAGARRSPSPVVNATTGPDGQELQGTSQPATEHLDGRAASPSLVRASGSASHARTEIPHYRRALSMATELLRYRAAPDRHNDWLQCIEELVAAAGDSAALSFSLRPQPSQSNNKEKDVPPPQPRPDARPEPRQEEHPRDRPCNPRARPGDEASYQLAPTQSANDYARTWHQHSPPMTTPAADPNTARQWLRPQLARKST
ncbi:hypothetical protein D1007_57178 [Hordeum vulgare]|nr:hypothetical protein D1007_57178 [Hordeum vulgare]